ncbi:ubinuclein-1 [Clupea harengus]|uniref:Ubinuclein-1 n=1 Tax=Clupea harengus TaxID=7950 RepID=A0A8M1KBV6_CLUHA|nr:ubinuclein-1 [Clupea harengus]
MPSSLDPFKSFPLFLIHFLFLFLFLSLPLIPRPTPSEARPPPQKQPRRPRSGPLNLDSVLRKLQHGKLQEFQFDRPLIAPPPTPLELSPPPPPASGSTNHQSTPPALLANQSTLPARITNQSTPPIDLTNQSTPPIDLTNQSTPLIDLTIQSTPPPRASVDQPVSQSSQKLVATPPHGLPSPLRACIRDLTQVARVCEGESKLKFFTQEVNSMLLDVEVRSRELGPAVRSRVFTHLSNHLPFSRDTLLKRARKLTHTPQVGSLLAALQKLKESIAMAMPEQIARFQDACRTFTDVRNAKANYEGREREQEEKKDEPEEEEEGEMKVGKGTTSSPPQKRIHWSKEMRALLCEVVQIKMGFYEQAKRQQPNAEEYLRNFLESEVKSLWPKGWMLTRILLKESHKAHLHLTNTCIRGKKRSVTNTKLKYVHSKHTICT